MTFEIDWINSCYYGVTSANLKRSVTW